MTRTEAEQLDCEIREKLKKFSKDEGVDERIADLIMDDYLEIIPDDFKKDMILLEKESVYYKGKNALFNLKATIVRSIELLLAIDKPDALLSCAKVAVQALIYIGSITRKKLDFDYAVIISILHKRNAYEFGVDREQIIDEINKMKSSYQIKGFNMDKLDEDIRDLAEWEIICWEGEKIYLKEQVYGHIPGTE